MATVSIKNFLSKINKTYPKWGIDAAFISLLITVFCLRFYLFRFVFQGDIFLNLYLHGNAALFRGGWDPYIWGYLGWYPIFGGMFPLNLVMHFFIDNVFKGSIPATIHILQVNAALSLFLLTFFSYLFLRFLRRGRMAAIAGSLIIALTGFHVHTSIREFDLFYTHSFMFVPLVLICLILANRKRSARWAVLGGIFIGISLLGGGNVPMFLFIPGFFLAYMFNGPDRELFLTENFLMSILYASIALIVGIAVGSAMVIPCSKYMGLSCRSFLNDEYRYYSVQPVYTFFTMLYRDWWPRSKTSLPLIQYHEFDAFLGLPVIFLALVGLSRPNRETGAKYIMIVLGLIALWCMHFRYMPDFLCRLIPALLAKISVRYPYRFFMVFLFPSAFFVSCGIDAFKDFCSSRRINLFLTLFAVAMISYCVVGMIIWRNYTMFKFQASFAAVLIITLGFSGFILLSALLAGGNEVFNRKIFPFVIVLLIFLLYYSSYTNTLIPFKYDDRTGSSDIAYKYPSIKDVTSILFEIPEGEYGNLPFKTPYRIYNSGALMLHRLNSWATRAHAYIAFEDPVDDPATGAFINKYYHCIADYESPLLDLYNVRFIKIITGYNGRKLLPAPLPQVYFNPQAFERFFIVHGARYFDSDEQIWSALKTASRDELKDNIFLRYPFDGAPRPPDTSDKSTETVRIAHMEPTRIALDVDLGSPGYLAVSEQWFPAWGVRVDGARQELLRAYGAFWGVSLPKGPHRVEFKFCDRYTLWGKAMSIISLFAAIAFVIFKKPRGHNL